MAPGEHAASNETVAHQTLWLSIRLGTENWLFEIEPDEDRAILVGSLLRAHVRISHPDVAPLHFHFEREHDRIRLCPAYGADLHVNGTPVTGPHELDGHTVITFAGLELEAYICDIEPNILEQLDLRDWSDPLPDCGGVLSLTDAAEPTRAMQELASPKADEPRASETKKYAPLCEVFIPPAAQSPSDGCIDPSLIVQVGRTTPARAHGSVLDDEPTLPGMGARQPGVSAGLLAPEQAVEESPSAPATWAEFQDGVRLENSIFNRVGATASKHPIRSALAALCASALLALAMVAIDGLVGPNAQKRSPLTSAASTSLPAFTAPAQLPLGVAAQAAASAETTSTVSIASVASAGSPQPKRTHTTAVAPISRAIKQTRTAPMRLQAPAPVSDPRIPSGL